MKPEIENNTILKPFSVEWAQTDGIMDDPDNHVERYLSKLTDMFADPAAAAAYLKEKGDALILHEHYPPRQDR